MTVRENRRREAVTGSMTIRTAEHKVYR